MSMAECVRFALEHNTWATRRVLEACRGLTPEQFAQDLSIGPGSLRSTLAHVIEAMGYYADNFAGKKPDGRADHSERTRTVDGLVAMLTEADAKLRAAMGPMLENPPSASGARIVWPSIPTRAVSAWAAIQQVFDHGSHHRAQCLNMLKRLGVSPLPRVDPLTFDKDVSTR